MKNLEKFSAKVQYVTPSCKSVELRSCQTILAGSYDSNWHTERYSVDEDEDL